jgi:hypothetical protein
VAVLLADRAGHFGVWVVVLGMGILCQE